MKGYHENTEARNNVKCQMSNVSRYDSFILFLMALGPNIQNVYSINSNLNGKQKPALIPQLCELITTDTKEQFSFNILNIKYINRNFLLAIIVTFISSHKENQTKKLERK